MLRNKLNLYSFIDPLVTSGIVSAGTSLLSGITGSSSSKKENAKQRKWQSEENQKSRDFNASEAQKSRNYQSQMYYEDRRYNSIKSQMQQYTEAGLNPSLMMSDGAQSIQGSMPSAASATSSPSGTSHSDPGQVLAGGIQKAGEAPLVAAQIKNLNSAAGLNDANAEKTAVETAIKQLEKDNWMEFRQSTLNLNQSQIELNKEEKRLVGQNFQVAAKRIEQLDAEIKIAEQQFANMKEDERTKLLDNFMKTGGLDPSMRERLKKEFGMDDKSCDVIATMFSLKVLESRAQIGNLNAQAYLAQNSARYQSLVADHVQYMKDNGGWSEELRSLFIETDNLDLTGKGIELSNIGQGFANAKAEFDSSKTVMWTNFLMDNAVKVSEAYKNAAEGTYNWKRVMSFAGFVF